MKVGDLVKKANHHDVDYLQNLIGLVLEVDYSTRQAGVLPIKVMWGDNYGTLWTLKQNVEVISDGHQDR